MRTTLRPRWLAVHALTAAIVTALVAIAQWQFRFVPKHQHGVSLRHVTYAVELYVFALFVLAMWARAMRDAKRKNSGPADRVDAELQHILDGPVTYRRYVAPQMDSAPNETDDPVRAAYNLYLSEKNDEARA